MKAFKETVMHWVESLRKKSSQQILQVQHQLVSISLMSVCLLFTHHTVPPSFQLNIPNNCLLPLFRQSGCSRSFRCCLWCL